MKFSYPKIFLLGFGFFGVSVIWAVYNTFVPVFLQNKFGLGAGWVGFFMTLDNIAALLIQPPVGAWSDRLRTPLGRRLPFILIGAPIGAVAFGLIPLAGALPLFVACTSSLLLSMAFWRTPVVALMPDITPSQYRSQANGIVNFMGGLGAIIATLGGGALYKLNPAYPFWMGSGLVIAATLLLLLFVKEPREFEESQERPNLLRSLKEVVQAQDKSTLRILLAIFCWFMAYNAIEAFFTLFAQNRLGLDVSDSARLLGQLSLVFVLFAFPAGFIGARIGRRLTILSGLVVMIVCLLAIFFLTPAALTLPLAKLPVLGVVPLVGAILMVLGAAWAAINVNSLPMVVDMTDNLHVGTYTGLYYLFSTLAAIVGPNLNGWVIQLMGNNYNLMMIIGPVFLVAAIVSMLGVGQGEAG